MKTNKAALNSSFLDYRDKVVFITGAAGQLGTVFCREFIRAGSRVVAADKVINKEKIIKDGSIDYVVLDITKAAAVKKAFDSTVKKFGRIDILINNAGVSVFEPFEQRPEKSFDRVMDINLKGTFWCIQNFVRCAKDRETARSIVSVASMYGLISPDPRIYTDCKRNNSEIYGATKAGIIQMTKYFAVHLAARNIRVNCVSPGGIFNPDKPQGADFVKNYSLRCPMGRMAKAHEVAGAVLYLASDAASYTNGHNLVVDGGMSAW